MSHLLKKVDIFVAATILEGIWRHRLLQGSRNPHPSCRFSWWMPRVSNNSRNWIGDDRG